jgi:hypothetical protein
MPDDNEWSGPICERCKKDFYYDFDDPNMRSRLCLPCYYYVQLYTPLNYRSVTERKEKTEK